jgi:hypothetical protein
MHERERQARKSRSGAHIGNPLADEIRVDRRLSRR